MLCFRLENPCAIALAEAFKTIGTLEEIRMHQNGINHEGITALAEAVKNSPNLRHINLNDNTFTEVGAISMAEAIKVSFLIQLPVHASHSQHLASRIGFCVLLNPGCYFAAVCYGLLRLAIIVS